ncbi:probable inactive poly [ADP-ribose] polymerase SRO2 [Magnolia sinica]|uniref:probable inactive poly [ADP-ribose] polymerase SRO2 n=1 Tax=Magnolia sinica TaxID=86752 RepID=UPI0026589498|nr:probable inactive poly [ADP-ribose] polymerase SRO2 [Magnolia sinica]
METVNSVKVSGLKKQKRSIRCDGYVADVRSKFQRVGAKNGHSSCPFDSKSVIKNYLNFVKSGSPQRVMFFNCGEWIDFPENVIALIVDAFRFKRSIVEISMRNMNYLVDFVGMVMTELKTSSRRSVAWIDEMGKCFFPAVYVEDDDMWSDGDKIVVEVDVGIGGACSSGPAECNSRLEETEVSSQVKEVIGDNGVPCRDDSGFDRLDLIKLERENNDYLAVQKAFVTSFGMFLTLSNVVGIYRYAPVGPAALARFHSFEERIEAIRRYRGDANVRRGWYGSSREGVAEVLTYGFGVNMKSSNGAAYGMGVYLAPEDRAYVSANFCDVDENGIQHMLLCRVTMGSMEQVPLGSEQFRPSSEDFDSGVDNLQNPNHYVVWSTHMNTLIHPEYIVSFKLPPSAREHFVGMRGIRRDLDAPTVKCQQSSSKVHQVKDSQDSTLAARTLKLPTSAWMPFPMLFAAIQNSLSPSAKDSLDAHYNDFKSKKITREELVKKLRFIAGDMLLISTLKRLKVQCKMA